MAKIRVAKDKDEASRVPADEPLAIDLSRTIETKQQDDKTPQPQQTPQEESGEPEPSLEAQLRQMKEAEERARARAAQAEAERVAAIQQSQQREQEWTRYTTGTQHESLVSAIAAVQSEAENAQQQYASALANQDFAAAAEAQRRLTRAESRLVSLESGKDELERRLQEQPRQQQVQYQTPQSNIEQVLAGMPGLMDSERDYLRRHPEAITNPANQRRLEVAFMDAQQQGLERGSDAYFQLFDNRLGYQTKPARKSEVEMEDDSEPPMVSAPVSRSAPSSQESETRVVLSPQQREAARWAGVDEITYAQGLLKLRQAKKEGLTQ